MINQYCLQCGMIVFLPVHSINYIDRQTDNLNVIHGQYYIFMNEWINLILLQVAVLYTRVWGREAM